MTERSPISLSLLVERFPVVIGHQPPLDWYAEMEKYLGSQNIAHLIAADKMLGTLHSHTAQEEEDEVDEEV